jgi:hypothetical protein
MKWNWLAPKGIDRDPDLAMCDFVPMPEDADAAKYCLMFYTEMRRYVEHEDELMNSRLTSSLTVHGFLFAAYGLVLSKYISPEMGAEPQALLFTVLAVVALTGAEISFSSQKAIVAGFNAIQHINTLVHGGGLLMIPSPRSMPCWTAAIPLRQPLPAAALLLPRIIRGGARRDTTQGAYNYYYKYLPVGLGWVWLILLALTLLYSVREIFLWMKHYV